MSGQEKEREEVVTTLTFLPIFRFSQQLMNWVDLLAILPYYISLTLSQLIAETSAHSSEEVNTVGKFLKLLKIIRISRSVRIFKLARHVEGLQALGYTFTARRNEFGLLLVFLTVGAFSFSSVIFLAEKDTGGSMGDMLDAYWWSFITMTTVGYGDIFPLTHLGRVTGICCATFGVIIIGERTEKELCSNIP